MSSDPTRPSPEWWEQPGPGASKGKPEDQDDQKTQAYPQAGRPGPAPDTQVYPQQGGRGNQGYPQGGSGFPPSGQGFPQSGQGYQQGGSGFPQGGQGFPQGGQGFQDYPGGQADGTQQYPGGGQGFPAAGAAGYQGRPRRVRRRRRRWPLVTLIVIIVILVGADRAAAAFTEDQMASQFASSLELSGKPHVTIQGFPFLTQLAGRDFNLVNINATNEAAGPGGQLEIKSLTATLHGMHIHGLNSATIDQFSASALITFTALGNAGGIPQGITLGPDGPNKIKANISIGPISDTAVAQVTQSGSGEINVKVIDAGGIPTDILGSLANFSIKIPKLPAGVTIQSVSVTQQGVQINVTGQNTTLSQ
jgi:hypothetical protein